MIRSGDSAATQRLDMAAEKIDHITLEGFKSVRSIEKLTLTPINVLIGANGSGKSNFISAFAFLNQIREGRLQDYVRSAGGADQILHFGSKETSSIVLDVSFANEVNRYALRLQLGADDSLYVSSEEVYFWDKTYPSPYGEGLLQIAGGREAGISDSGVTGIANWVRNRLGRFKVYHLHDTSGTSPMRKTAQVDDNRLLRQDAANLAAFLYLLSEKHRDELAMIRKTIQRVTPFFDNFSLEPDPRNEETIRLAWTHKESDKFFGASTLSDGTLRFIALATLFLQPAKYRPAIIVIDEPELGLHPAALAMLASMVKQVSVETQVILSTQSALLLDHFAPEDVLVAERVGDETQFTRLDATSLSEWLEDYSLGQLWEKNEFGGRP
jgi:predicted ATPase